MKYISPTKRQKKDLQRLLIATKNVSSVNLSVAGSIVVDQEQPKTLSGAAWSSGPVLSSFCSDSIWHGSLPALTAARRMLTVPLEQIRVDAEAHWRDLLPPRM